MLNIEQFQNESVSMHLNSVQRLANGVLKKDDENGYGNWYIEYFHKASQQTRRLYFEPEFVISLRVHDQSDRDRAANHYAE